MAHSLILSSDRVFFWFSVKHEIIYTSVRFIIEPFFVASILLTVGELFTHHCFEYYKSVLSNKVLSLSMLYLHQPTLPPFYTANFSKNI